MRAIAAGAALASVVFFGAAASADTAHAASERSASAGAFVPLPPDAVKRLKSSDAVQVKSALDDVRVSGKAGVAAVPAIVERLRAGLTPALTLAAIETLGDTESETATDILAWYSHHRNVEIRRTAIQSLARTKGTQAVTALRNALSDPDPAVRGLSATALGDMRAKDAVPALFAALEHNVPEAAAAIGELCSDTDCERLAAKIGHMPFDVVTSGLDEVLLRPPVDVKDEIKVKIVGRVREMGTAEANRFLKGVQTRWPTRASARVKQAIDQAVIATASSPGADEATRAQ
ncbi:MAG TPA: HEAT repeat domain-containing protein [Polyangiaceae bacterium]|jgi:HEAT repeat protein|nr:HEAT repeat domain-containing protein [Polyangiaceae bacterium]